MKNNGTILEFSITIIDDRIVPALIIDTELNPLEIYGTIRIFKKAIDAYMIEKLNERMVKDEPH